MSRPISKNQQIFTVSGCLTAEALELFAKGELQGDLLYKAQLHLDTCEFCSVSLEGLKIWISRHEEPKASGVVASGKSKKSDTGSFSEKSRQIHEHLHDRLMTHVQAKTVKKTRRVPVYTWLSVAATVVLFFGIILLLKYRPFSGHTTTAENQAPPEQQVEKPLITPRTEESAPATLPASYSEKKTLAVVSRIPKHVVMEEEMSANEPLAGLKDTTLIGGITVPLNLEPGQVTGNTEAAYKEAEQPATAKNYPVKTITTLVPGDKMESGNLVQAETIEGVRVQGRAAGVNATRKGKEEIFSIVEKMPEFPGGQAAMISYFSEHLPVTLDEKQKLLEGTVYAEFIVQPDGRLRDIRILRGASGSLKRNIEKALETMPAWIPGENRGVPVPVKMVLPIRLEFHDNR